ncbi:hypothetical protein FRC02_007316 [Tulasnella sp. 418]|nr:hypothetical protein FRC02_007316 [Tulasnella sp. 418]
MSQVASVLKCCPLRTTIDQTPLPHPTDLQRLVMSLELLMIYYLASAHGQSPFIMLHYSGLDQCCPRAEGLHFSPSCQGSLESKFFFAAIILKHSHQQIPFSG